MPTNVPMPTLGLTGFSTQSDSAILTGVIADIQAAFGGALNLSSSIPSSLTTPQGQLASSISAIVSDGFAQFLQLAAQTDPQYAQGAWQDAIGNIYFMKRIPATGTTVSAVASGQAGTVIPGGVAVAQDGNGNGYACSNAVTGAAATILAPAAFVATTNSTTLLNVTSMTSGAIILGQAVTGAGIPSGTYIAAFVGGSGGTGTYALSQAATASASGVNMTASGTAITLTNVVTGPIVYVSPMSISQATPGWDKILLPVQLLLGSVVETQQAFEARRQASVGANSLGSIGSIKGSVLAALANAGLGTSVYVTENFSNLAITTGGVLLPPNSLYVAVAGGTALASVIANAIWQTKPVGCSYAPSVQFTATLSNAGNTAAGNVLNVTSVLSGTLAVGQTVMCASPSLPASLALTIVSLGTGTGGIGTYNVSSSANWVNSGASMTASTVVAVLDTSYATPQPTYYVQYTTPVPVPIYIQVTLAASSLPPTNALALITAAIPNAFSGADGGVPVSQIGATVFGSRFYSTVAAAITNAQILSVLVSTSTSFAANPTSVPMGINQIPTLATVSLVLG